MAVRGGAELVGHGGDELRLDFLTLADFQGHIVDVVHQLPHLIGVGVGQLDAVAAAGDALGGVRHLSHRATTLLMNSRLEISTRQMTPAMMALMMRMVRRI